VVLQHNPQGSGIHTTILPISLTLSTLTWLTDDVLPYKRKGLFRAHPTHTLTRCAKQQPLRKMPSKPYTPCSCLLLQQYPVLPSRIHSTNAPQRYQSARSRRGVQFHTHTIRMRTVTLRHPARKECWSQGAFLSKLRGPPLYILRLQHPLLVHSIHQSHHVIMRHGAAAREGNLLSSRPFCCLLRLTPH
jgi:hypothetical protein